MIESRDEVEHDYARPAQAVHGILHEDERLELLEGEIVEMSPIGRAHAACVNRATRLFTSALGPRAIVGIRNPIQLDDRSEPQPDVALQIAPRADFYDSRLPGPEDVLLVVEVADPSVEYDRDVKIPLSAKAGIAESWLVSLACRTIRSRDPGVRSPRG